MKENATADGDTTFGIPRPNGALHPNGVKHNSPGQLRGLTIAD